MLVYSRALSAIEIERLADPNNISLDNAIDTSGAATWRYIEEENPQKIGAIAGMYSNYRNMNQ